ncbi:cellulose biosynthesis protein BcsN [Prosthecomicrobium pneumaticum]|uniref:Cellulose biosynthesis protein BcsN n=1 Tax=Prosthecomicrobium pneumaticum TaxID=81895 RepID=A0A7W9FK35_9HYPH|nr:cellulose biosynthesis protein BcsN [Prosthecomicrobium pneumaticum]MBB5752367.1 hypothetical protein [Prosthecomicrobium pneumaticum]
MYGWDETGCEGGRRGLAAGVGLRRCAIALSALLLAGCTSVVPVESGRLASRVAPEQAMVDLPPGGPGIVGIVATELANAHRQEIILGNRSRTPGENRMTVTVFGPVAASTGPENTAGNPPVDIGAVARDMRAAVPGVAMSVSPYYAQNRYGAFGYATGRSAARDLCFYGWQRIRAPDLDDTLFARRGTLAIRLRICDPDATEQDLVAVMAGFTINSYLRAPGWNPYGDPPPLAADFGRAGAVMLPDATVTGAIAPAPAAAAPRRRTAAAAAPADAPMQGYPDVPMPAGSSAAVAPSPSAAAPAAPGAASERYQDFEVVPLPGGTP